MTTAHSKSRSNINRSLQERLFLSSNNTQKTSYNNTPEIS